MVLTDRERTVALIAGGIASFSFLSERGEIPKGATMFDFILRSMPDDLRSQVDAALIDDVFCCVALTP